MEDVEVMNETTPSAIAIILVSQRQAALLNGSGALNERSRAYAYGQCMGGTRFDGALVLDRAVDRKERDWLTDVLAPRIKPGGVIAEPTY